MEAKEKEGMVFFLYVLIACCFSGSCVLNYTNFSSIFAVCLIFIEYNNKKSGNAHMGLFLNYKKGKKTNVLQVVTQTGDNWTHRTPF